MSSSHMFSEVSLAFSAHAANLNRARHAFEDDAGRLNEFVIDHLYEFVARPPREDRPVKFRWDSPCDLSTARDVSWLNFYARTQVALDILPPGFARFKRAAAYVYFETVFDAELERFVFQARLENQNTVNDSIDETVSELLQAEPDGIFPNSHHIKTNTTVLYRRELGNELFECLNQAIDAVMILTENAIDRIYPDSLYEVNARGELERA